MPEPSQNPVRLGRQQARALILAAQNLIHGDNGKPADLVEVLEQSGFVRTLGGADVYLALRARLPGLKRADLDTLVADQKAQVLPAARGCMYLLARRHAPLALRVAERLSTARDLRDQEKAGIRPGEVDAIAVATLETLRAKGPLPTHAIRQALPEGLVRSLGDAGKKVGVSSPLPAALRRLEFRGDIERRLEEGRLDSERYLWQATAKNLFEDADLPEDVTSLHARFGEIFFRAAGLSTRKAFADWAGLSQKEAQAAMAALPLVPVAVEGEKETYAMLEEKSADLAMDLAAATIAFLPFEDNSQALQGVPSLLIDAAYHDIEVPAWGMGGKKSRLGDAKHSQLRSIVAEGRMAGFWEFDPEKQIIVNAWLGANNETRRRAETLAENTAAFLRDEIGHAHSFSLDTDYAMKSRATFVASLAI